MTISEILFIFVLVFGLINFIHLGLYIVGGNIYDIKAIKRKKTLESNQDKKQPTVTVLIPAHNEAKAIIRCIDSVSKSTYKHIRIVVIDDASTDTTSQIVENYIHNHSRRAVSSLIESGALIKRRYYKNSTSPIVCLLHLPANGGKAEVLNYGLKYAVHDGLVMTLDADSILDKNAIKNAVAYFYDSKVVGLAANVKIIDQFSVLGLLQKFEHMIGYRSKKFYSLASAEFIIGGVASTYRYDVLEKVGYYDTDTTTEDIGLSMKIVAQGNIDQRIIYAADVIAKTEGVCTFSALLKQRYRWKMGSLQNLFKYRDLFVNRDKAYSKMLTYYRMPMSLLSELILILEPIALSYIIYVSIVYLNVSILVGGYLTIFLYILWTVWPDEHHTIRQKIILSCFAPGMYFCFFIMDIVQIIAIFRCLVHYTQITKRNLKHITWTSPERLGGTAS